MSTLPNKLTPIKTTVFDKEVIGFYTDDTSQAICLAESLIENNFDTKDQFTKYKKWLVDGYATPFEDRSYGAGQHTFKVLTLLTENTLPTAITDNPKAGGNGALMRTAPIGILYHKNTANLVEHSLKSAIVTHNNTIASWSCVILNTFIHFALNNKHKSNYCEQLLSTNTNIPEELQVLLKTNFNEITQDEIPVNGYAINTLTISLHAFFTTNSFKECVTKSITIGGDTDTQGAVAGALAGAYYGYDEIPKVWKNNLIKHDYIKNLAERLYQKALV